MLWTEPLVICGFGEMGSAVARFAIAGGRHPHQIVVVEQDEARARLARSCGYRTVVSDAACEAALRSAGVGVASRIIICLVRDDRAAQAAGAARSLAPSASIEVVVADPAAERAVRDAGADMVLSLSRIAGSLLAASVPSHSAEDAGTPG